MKTLEKVTILKNVGSSWFALGVHVLTGIFLSPYILHRLGDQAFGLWILIFSVTGYYGLFDLGIRSSVVRYVAKYMATQEHDLLNRLVNTAAFAYGAIGMLCLVVTIVGAKYVGAIFRVPAEFLETARWLFLMAGTSVALGFPLAVFGGILEGMQRFYLLNLTSVLSTAARALLVVIALRHGYGLLTIALITVALPLAAAALNGLWAMHTLRVSFSLRYVDRSSFKRMANYSATTLMIITAGRLRFKTDAIIIGGLLSSAAITYFTIGSRLIDYAGELVSSLAQIFVPMSSQSQAQGDHERLRKILIAGNRGCALIIFPIAAVLALLGKPVWVGAKYVAASYPVLLILLGPSTLMLAQSASGRILWGMAKHRTLAWVVLAEGAVNAALSVMLVRPYGIVGDAIGTAIPLALTMLFFMPHHICRLLQIRLGTYVRQAFLLPLILCGPLVLVLWILRQKFTAHNYFQLAVELLICAAVYGSGLAWAVWTKRAWNVEGPSDAEQEEYSLSRMTHEHS
jgi:O-antigen/teichoic acid export membrane protein